MKEIKQHRDQCLYFVQSFSLFRIFSFKLLALFYFSDNRRFFEEGVHSREEVFLWHLAGVIACYEGHSLEGTRTSDMLIVLNNRFCKR